MANGPPTVTQLKERFISSQTTLLSNPPQPSAAFRAANERSDAPIDPRQLTTVTQVLEHLVSDHCKRIYAPQANRALAEQISQGYNLEVERKLERDGEGEDAIGKEVDLANDKAIESLPSTWPVDKDINNHPMEAKMYADATSRLTSLNEQRREIRQRVERLRRVKATIDPLQTKDGGAGVQENLITRNGEVEKELEKMRMLLVRVGGRVDMLSEESGERKEEEVKPLSALRKRGIDDFLSDGKMFPTE